MIDLVLKWSPRRRADAIDCHRAVATERGSVWWGRIAFEESPIGLAGHWVKTLQEQLSSAQETYVFLHSSAGGTWQTELRNVATEKAAVNADLIPAYYDLSFNYSLWVELRQFHQINPMTLVRNYVLARTGGPLTVRGLNNQTPLILRRGGNSSRNA